MNIIYVNDYEQNIIKLKRNNIYDVSIRLLDLKRVNNEF